MTPLYTATATATAGRAGKVSTDDGTLALDLSVPKGIGGPGGAGTNPEQLFAAGYSACFGGALGLVAGMKKTAVGKFDITAKVSIGKTETGGFGLAVALIGNFPDLADKAVAKELMEAAHQVCPYSNATRNNIEVVLEVASLARTPNPPKTPRRRAVGPRPPPSARSHRNDREPAEKAGADAGDADGAGADAGGNPAAATSVRGVLSTSTAANASAAPQATSGPFRGRRRAARACPSSAALTASIEAGRSAARF